MNYRKVWIKHHGEIPFDSEGRSYDIHHIDGDRKNNDISNLICLSVEDHLKIHLEQYEKTGNIKDLASYRILCGRLQKDVKTLSGYKISDKTKEKIRRKLTGHKRPPDVVERVGNALKGIVWSKDALQKRSNGLKRYYETATDEELKERWDKISISNKGKKIKEETKEKLSKLNSKLNDNEVLEIDNLIKLGETYNNISNKYGISPAQITSIKQRKTYKWLWTY